MNRATVEHVRAGDGHATSLRIVRKPLGAIAADPLDEAGALADTVAAAGGPAARPLVRGVAR